MEVEKAAAKAAKENHSQTTQKGGVPPGASSKGGGGLQKSVFNAGRSAGLKQLKLILRKLVKGEVGAMLDCWGEAMREVNMGDSKARGIPNSDPNPDPNRRTRWSLSSRKPR